MTRTLSILYLTPGCFDKGGISRYTRYQIEALRACESVGKVTALSLLGPDTDAIETPFKVDWQSSARPGAVTRLHRLHFSLRALWCAFRNKPDIVHIAHVNFTPLALLMQRLSGGKTILNVYGLEIWSGLSKKRTVAMSKMDYIISDCHFTADYVIEQGLHAQVPTVIWDPVDLEVFSPGPVDKIISKKYGLPDPSSHQIIMSLGRLAKAAAHKGFDRLISVFSALAEDFPSARLVIAGRGDDRPRLEAIARQEGVEDRVHFTGSVDEEDLGTLYRMADVFSLVSDRGHGRGEGIPLTPLEAMACGAPIIVGNEDGSQEAVFSGRNGQIVSPRDQKAHVEAISTILSDADLAKSMSEAAREIAREHFSYEGFVSKHERFLSKSA